MNPLSTMARASIPFHTRFLIFTAAFVFADDPVQRSRHVDPFALAQSANDRFAPNLREILFLGPRPSRQCGIQRPGYPDGLGDSVALLTSL